MVIWRIWGKHIIARDIAPDVMKQRIEDLIYPIIDQVLKGNYKGFCFKIPKSKGKGKDKDRDQLEYHDGFCFPLLKHGGDPVKRNFFYANRTHTAAMTTWVLKIIFEHLDRGYTCTLRDLFYRRGVLFLTQTAFDRMVSDVCYLFGCTRRSLNLVSEEKGSVCGNVKIHLKDGRTLDCNHKVLVPDETQIQSCIIGKDVKYILIVEKGTIFSYLDRFKFNSTENCIMITSHSFPDISSRRLLRLLKTQSKLPVVGVADPDPSGLAIMRCYSQGSENLAIENLNLAVPFLIWAGISLFDIEAEKIQLTEYNSTEFTEDDVATLDSLASDKYTKLSPKWLAAVNKMRLVGRKVSFEMLHEQGFSYVATELLPKLIKRAMVFKEQSTPD